MQSKKGSHGLLRRFHISIFDTGFFGCSVEILNISYMFAQMQIFNCIICLCPVYVRFQTNQKPARILDSSHTHVFYWQTKKEYRRRRKKKMKRKDFEKKIKLKLVYCIIDNIIGHSVGKIESAHKSHLAMSVICYLFRLRKSYFSFRQRTLSDIHIPKHTQYTHTYLTQSAF